MPGFEDIQALLESGYQFQPEDMPILQEYFAALEGVPASGPSMTTPSYGSTLAGALLPSGPSAPPDMQRLIDDYKTKAPGSDGGMSTELYRYAQDHPDALIDRSGNNYTPDSPLFNFYNPLPGQTPGLDWWLNDDRNNPYVNSGGSNSGGVDVSSPGNTAIKTTPPPTPVTAPTAGTFTPTVGLPPEVSPTAPSVQTSNLPPATPGPNTPPPSGGGGLDTLFHPTSLMRTNPIPTPGPATPSSGGGGGGLDGLFHPTSVMRTTPIPNPTSTTPPDTNTPGGGGLDRLFHPTSLMSGGTAPNPTPTTTTPNTAPTVKPTTSPTSGPNIVHPISSPSGTTAPPPSANKPLGTYTPPAINSVSSPALTPPTPSGPTPYTPPSISTTQAPTLRPPTPTTPIPSAPKKLTPGSDDDPDKQYWSGSQYDFLLRDPISGISEAVGGDLSPSYITTNWASRKGWIPALNPAVSNRGGSPLQNFVTSSPSTVAPQTSSPSVSPRTVTSDNVPNAIVPNIYTPPGMTSTSAPALTPPSTSPLTNFVSSSSSSSTSTPKTSTMPIVSPKTVISDNVPNAIIPNIYTPPRTPLTPPGGGADGTSPATPPNVDKAINSGKTLTNPGPSTSGNKSSIAPPGGTAQLLPTTPTQNPDFNPPLALYGHSNIDQARMLVDWLKSQGVDAQSFVVGGKSGYDTAINAAIDKINNPNTTDVERQLIARELGSLISLRASNMIEHAPDAFSYDPKVGAPSAPPGAVGGTTAAGYIGNLYNPNTEPDKGRVLSDFLSSYMPDLNEQQRLGTSSIVSQLEGAAGRRKQQLADSLASSGLEGGQSADRLTQFEQGALSDRTNALLDFQRSLLDQQQSSKQNVLQALLQDAAQQQQRQLEQAGLGATTSQFGDTLNYQRDLADVQFQLQKRSQDIALIMQLLQQAAAGDEAANQRALALLTSIGSV